MKKPSGDKSGLLLPFITKKMGIQELQAGVELSSPNATHLTTQDQVKGKIILINSGKSKVYIKHGKIHLSSVQKGPYADHLKGSKTVTFMGKRELAPGERLEIPVPQLGRFTDPSYAGRMLSQVNLVKISLTRHYPVKMSYTDKVRQLGRGHEFDFQFEVPVCLPPGFYFAYPKVCDMAKFEPGWLSWASIVYLLLLFIWAVVLALSFSLHVMVVGALVSLLAWATIKLSAFKNISLKVAGTPGSSMKVRMLDLGDEFRASLRVGYRINEYYEGAFQPKDALSNVLRKEYIVGVDQAARNDGPFLVVSLPWPEKVFPVSRSLDTDHQGVHWELVLQRTSFWGKISELTWPLHVNWEHRPPPEEILELKDLTPEREILGGTPGATNNKQ
ncbi:hypothetical protein [Lewinella sp. W8]|uniref:hypothetical protein n=1 Tax=Lewinella sp. W8 TaxID=2528208 RepID=UPI001067FB41|nr:hypothetical protein [Lewinella sp. W8]MTB53832.1 hypothetical protein [Lewinella sp. W8]